MHGLERERDAAGKSREPGASPPPMMTMFSAPMVAASSIMRLLSSIAARSFSRPAAANRPPRQ
jgi:hypothetical protein